MLGGGVYAELLSSDYTPPLLSKVLVTGATGVIGNYAVDILGDIGLEVFGVSRSGNGRHGIPLNLHDTGAVESFMKAHRPGYLLHLAWNMGAGSMSSTENLDWVMSSLSLLKIFAEYGGKRAVFAGSCFEYDMNYGFLSEDTTPLKSESFYGSSKTALYNLALKWSEIVGLSFAWGRIFFTYGRGERKERLVPDIIDSLLRGEKPKIRYPYILRDYTFAGDIAGGLVKLLLNDYCGAVNIGSGVAVPLCSIAEKAAVLMGCPIPEYEIVPLGDMPPMVAADTRRLNDVVGFRPSVSWEEGLSEMIAWRKECTA